LTHCHISERFTPESGIIIRGEREAMRNVRPLCVVLALALLASPVWLPLPSHAQDAKSDAKPQETEAEKRERETRRVCAISLCSTLRNKKPAEGNVSCSVQKTWHKDHLTKILSKGGLSWPWGNARCSSELKFDRATLIKAMSEKQYEAQFDPHDVSCELDLEKEKYLVKLQIHPKVTFMDGKAVKAALNWGKIDAPTLAKSALWSATAADNSFGVLQSTVVEDINDFIQNKCEEVKEEWQGK
jgi:hypothetical protein